MTEDHEPYDPTPAERGIFDIARDLAAAKAAEESAKARRAALEDELAALVPPVEGRQQSTARVAGLKVTVKRPVRYAVDPEAFRLETIPPNVFETCFRHKESWDVVPRNYEALRQLNPAAFADLSRYVTAKPGKVSVELSWENPL